MQTLYKRAATGKILEWSIWVEGCTVVTRYGEVGGQLQMAHDTIVDGKNLGRVNATTATQQALAEAQSRWTRQIQRRGYVADPQRAARGETDAEGGIAPMLAHVFSKHGGKIVYPAYVQPKLDGARATADEEGMLWTRQRKLISSVPHINASTQQLMWKLMLDGELYSHRYRSNFEQIMSMVRSATPQPGHELIEFHVYDIPHPTAPFARRLEWLNMLAKVRLPGIVVVETLRVENEEQLMAAFERFIAQGYEGAMVRNAAGLYVNRRSYDLQKIKEFDDGEWCIVGIYEGRGKLAGHGIFICALDPNAPTVGVLSAAQAEALLKQGHHFAVKMKGDTAALAGFLHNYYLYDRRMLTVQYQGLTNKNGVPRFPVGLRFA